MYIVFLTSLWKFGTPVCWIRFYLELLVNGKYLPHAFGSLGQETLKTIQFINTTAHAYFVLLRLNKLNFFKVSVDVLKIKIK